MELIERLPLNRLNLLKKISLKEFKKLTPNCKNDKDRAEYYNSFKRYVHSHIRCKGEMKMLYKHTDTTRLGEGGRLFSAGSIQGISRDIRGFLCEGETTDIDMSNAHPTILEYLCLKHKIKCPMLEYYNRNREACWNDVGENAKTMFLIAVNDSKIQKTKDKFFKDFDKEMKRIQADLILYYDVSVPIEKKHNFLGSAINRILCIHENEILQKIVNKVNELGFEICSLMFDGLMIYGNHYNNEELKDTLENEIKEYGIKLKYKRHSTSLTEDELKALPMPEDEDLDELSASQQLFKEYPHWVNCNNDLYVFDEDAGMWSCDEAIVHKYIIKYANGSFSRSHAKREGVKKTIKTFCVKNDWLIKAQETSRGYLLFNNGIFNGKEGKFYSKKEYPYNPMIVFFYKIDYDFDISIISENDVEDVKQRLFTLPLGEEVGNYFLEQLSMGLMGDMLKRFILALGESNAGKSLISKALAYACGEYVGSFNAESLAYSKSDSDEASKLRWLQLLCNKRLIFSNELKMNVEINGNMIKKLSSGGDTLIGRQHNCAETQFKCLPLAVVFANDIPKIKPYDTALDNRIRVVSYNKKFVEEPTKSDELKSDPEIENEIKTLKFQMSLVMLLLKTYVDVRDNGAMKEPESVKAAKKEWLDEEPDMIKSLLEYYEFTDNKDDFIMSTELQDWVNGKNISITKLGREINKYADLNKYENIKVIVKKIEGKCVRVWTGIKLN